MASGSESQELLVVLAPGAGQTSRDAVAVIAPVLHSASDQVFAVRGDAAQVARVRQVPGVSLVLVGHESENVLRNLSPTEELFAKAWLMARQPKQRKGEGLPWDAPGHLPPDPPKR